MKLNVVNTEGKGVDPIDADDAVFGIEPNPFVIHQALLAQLANRRTGTAKTKTRGEVAGSTAKIRRQKGTGRARLGAASAPTIRHGGVAFGPRPRSFDQRLPKRMRRLAIRSVLSAKVAEGSLRVLDALAFERPRTKEMASLLQTLGLDRSTLVVTETSDRGVLVSARNLEKIDVLAASYLNVGDMLSHQNLLMTVGAVRQAERLWGGERALRRRAPLPELQSQPVAVTPSAPSRTRRRPTAPAPLEAPVAEKPAPRRRRVALAPAEAPAPEKPAPRRRRMAAASPPEASVPKKTATPRRRKTPSTPEEGAANA
ncbi:MAG: 50S ribosomal protein L4 [Dehalococcoidia bacterium]|nr:50S ribosomal protein L4 [Dehalococcoidia bacterium]